MQTLLCALRAAGEASRLRLLAVLARSELTVTELTRVLGQSQPRISRHLKLLTDVGLVSRYQEGSWVFYRLADAGPALDVVRAIVALLPSDDPALVTDLERLQAIKRENATAAATYFRDNASEWDQLRRLYIEESKVEQAMLEVVAGRPIGALLDLGTGTGRILKVFAPHIKRGIGIDQSREMLAVARANLSEPDAAHCQVRMGDIYHLPQAGATVDVVTIHHVLHFLDDPAAAVAEAARTLRRDGRMLIVDFAPHGLEFLRTEHAHRRLGFSDDEVRGWLRAAGLKDLDVKHLASRSSRVGERLTVSLWPAVNACGRPQSIAQRQVA